MLDLDENLLVELVMWILEEDVPLCTKKEWLLSSTKSDENTPLRLKYLCYELILAYLAIE